MEVTWLYKGMIRAAGELDCFSAHIRLREPDKLEDKAEYANVATKEAKDNKIGTSPATRRQRPYMRVTVCLSIDQGGLLGGHSGVEVGGRKGRGSDDESNEAQLPKNKVSVRKEVESEEHHSAAEGIYRSRRKGCRCKATDSRAMGLVALWYVEAGLPWSHRSLALMEGEHWS
ncbi:hypothetical protein B296_00053873 [Ensete ventricosum]|uniref:Uncharacterized protein n=1 Tax=Ensete ventricosum TaxID=4639 RepID=A0A426X659_ENSVE|nr:hypothetical protein B296_00053873 [Ensete ventricosum]